MMWIHPFVSDPNLTPPLDTAAARDQKAFDTRPFHEWHFPDGTPWTAFHRTPSGYLLRFPELADFAVSGAGLDIRAYPVPGVSRQTLEHLYLNQVLPLALSRQFKLVLHASAVEAGGFAVGFLGVSGRGKSTLAASFAAAGYGFLTDDGLQLEEQGGIHHARPSHPSIRLWEDSRQALLPETVRIAPSLEYTPKSRLLADDEVAYCNETRPLRALYFLGENNTEKIAIEPLSGRDAMVELVRHCFLLDIEEREMLQRHFQHLTNLVKSVGCFKLEYPRRYEVLPEVHAAVVKHVCSIQENEKATPSGQGA